MLKKRYPFRAGTIHTLERYLVASGLIVDGRQAETQTSSLSGEYTGHLREVRGFATSTVSSHRRTAQCFLQHLVAEGTALRRTQSCHVESYIAQADKRLSRASLQHDIAALRGFLRFLATDGRAPTGLDRQIDTPRLYRLERTLAPYRGKQFAHFCNPWTRHRPWGPKGSPQLNRTRSEEMLRVHATVERNTRSATVGDFRVNALSGHYPAYDPTRACDGMVTMEEAAQRLGVSSTSIRRMIKLEKMPATQVVACAPWQIAIEALESEEIRKAVRNIKARARAPRTQGSNQQQAMLPMV